MTSKDGPYPDLPFGEKRISVEYDFLNPDIALRLELMVKNGGSWSNIKKKAGKYMIFRDEDLVWIRPFDGALPWGFAPFVWFLGDKFY